MLLFICENWIVLFSLSESISILLKKRVEKEGHELE